MRIASNILCRRPILHLRRFNKWISSGFYKKNMPKRFGYRMRLSPERVKQMVDEVKKEHDSATYGGNKNE